jgi:hypothetical protein
MAEITLKEWNSQDSKKIRATFGAYQAIYRKRYFLNKSSLITFMIPNIIELFPDARFIHIYRDGRAVALSYSKKSLRQIRTEPQDVFNHLLEKTAKTWNESILEIERQRKDCKLDKRGMFHEVGYEDFCSTPKEHVKRIASFLGLDPNRFQTKNYSNIKNMNYKFKENLDLATSESLTNIMKPALVAKGYLTKK